MMTCLLGSFKPQRPLWPVVGSAALRGQMTSLRWIPSSSVNRIVVGAKVCTQNKHSSPNCLQTYKRSRPQSAQVQVHMQESQRTCALFGKVDTRLIRASPEILEGPEKELRGVDADARRAKQREKGDELERMVFRLRAGMDRVRCALCWVPRCLCAAACCWSRCHGCDKDWTLTQCPPSLTHSLGHLLSQGRKETRNDQRSRGNSSRVTA